MKINSSKIRVVPISSVLLAFAISFACNLSTAETSKVENPAAQPVEKPTDGKGAMPTFAEADIDNDHLITKDELKNFPYMLQVFDKVDAGEDGKLEQHEYQNLKMETKREAEVR